MIRLTNSTCEMIMQEGCPVKLSCINKDTARAFTYELVGRDFWITQLKLLLYPGPPLLYERCPAFKEHQLKLMSVRLWNFKDGGSYNARVLPKNQHAQRKLFQNNPAMSYGLSKSAEIVLSKSIFYVKNWLNFFKKKII